MNFTSVLFTAEQPVAVIKLNRPEVLNSFNKTMALELQESLKFSAGNETIRAVLLTGNGKAFSAGQDLSEAAPKVGVRADIAQIVRELYNPVIRLIREIEKPVVCAVNGIAAGAGANIALACDIVIASDKASFIQAFSKIGLIPDSGGTYFLPRLIGFQKASALMMLGDKISAEEALQMGMIYKAVPDENLFDTAFGIAAYLADQPTKGLGLIKRALNRSLFNDLDSQLKLEEELQQEAGSTEDYREGVRAFLEKRTPLFKGR